MEADFSDYQELGLDSGFSTKTPVKPEDEFFHAVYISGQQRKNHLGETELPGKLQIRGLRSNLDELKMIIITIKQVLVKSVRDVKNNRENLECFSYQNGNPPWNSTTNHLCGKNSTERASVDFCKACRSQLIIAGLYLDEHDRPFMIDGKPSYVFIRAKGVKYGNASNYLSDLAKREDLDPIFIPKEGQNPEDVKKFEKANVNHKRFVTIVTVGKQSTNYGLKDVFEFKTGGKLSTNTVLNALNKSKEIVEKFKEKFDWTKNSSSGTTDYSTQPVAEDQKFTDLGKDTTNTNKPPQTSQPTTASIGNLEFDDISF